MPMMRLRKWSLKSLVKPTRPLQWVLVRLYCREQTRAYLEIFDHEYYNPVYPDAGLVPELDYLLWGAAKGRDPHPLFSSTYYLGCNPDVKSWNGNALLHYLKHGAAEGRDPHPLFSTKHYLTCYPEIANWGNPLLHYLTIGQYDHRQPHPAFDPEFYRITYGGDLAGCGTLMHYLTRGQQLGFAPRLEFDPAYYLRANADVAESGMEPFTHYIRFGLREGRETRAARSESSRTESYFPAAVAPRNSVSPLFAKPVDVVIPVYLGYEETRKCIESVLASPNSVPASVVVINDATPDPLLSSYLASLLTAQKVYLVEHRVNAGFVASANEGMALHPDRDIILLNSDTIVNGNWVDRLQRCAYGGRVASVSPFSNNATICSFPRNIKDNELPKGHTIHSVDDALREINAGRHCNLPTTIGFCMYIRRDALEDVGCFDEVTFRKGYGEENDFCIRALNRGWGHRLAADVFVYHAGSVSFGAATEARTYGMQALLGKHPSYLEYVDWHLRIDPANAFRIAVITHLLHNLGKEALLRIVGDEHCQIPTEGRREQDGVLVFLRPCANNHVLLFTDVPGYEFAVMLHAKLEAEIITGICRELRVARVECTVKAEPSPELTALIERLAGYARDATVTANQAG